MKNEEKVLEKYGAKIFRIYQIFLAWSVEIAATGGSSAYQIVCHKNQNSFDRDNRFVGAKVEMGERDKLKSEPAPSLV